MTEGYKSTTIAPIRSDFSGLTKEPVKIDSSDRVIGHEGTTINKPGTTIVPMEVKILPDGDVLIRAKDKRYTFPGPDEVQKFD